MTRATGVDRPLPGDNPARLGGRRGPNARVDRPRCGAAPQGDEEDNRWPSWGSHGAKAIAYRAGAVMATSDMR
jgi:hypothetical protein